MGWARHSGTWAAAAVWLAAGSAQASSWWGETVSRSVDVPAEQLLPGQWVWAAQEAPQGPIVVVVDLDRQLARAWRNGVLIGYTAVSTGKKGHETPTGVFHTLQKDRDHHSSKYHNASMPYTQRLTWDGVALHAGGLPGYPSSHGCVHLPSAFAERLFEVSPMGMTVVVARAGATPAEARLPLPIAPVDASTGAPQPHPLLADGQAYEWAPERAPQGPVSLVLSRRDARLVVLRAGVEIGRARLVVDDPDRPLGTHAFVAQAETPTAPGGLRWIGLPVPGHADDAGRGLTPAEIQRVRLPPDFLARLRGALAPGSTLVVTDTAILPQTTGAAMTVVTNEAPE